MCHGTDFCVGLPKQISSPGTKIEKYVLMSGGDGRLVFRFKVLKFASTSAAQQCQQFKSTINKITLCRFTVMK
jgi:hypothetical protein